MSHGKSETSLLQTQVKDQMNRLITQLQDLEDLRAELDDDEYEETRKDTLDQMAEFDESLRKMMAGDMTLVDELGAVKLAIQAAIKQAFKTPEVIKLFAAKEPGQLRARAEKIQEERKLGRLSEEAFTEQYIEIIIALRKLGEQLTQAEKGFLDANDSAMAQMESADKAIGEGIISVVESSVKEAGQ